MLNLWQLFLYQPILNLLLFCYKAAFSNLGLAIIALTLIIRFLLLPIVLPSLRAAEKQKSLRPELDALKVKFKDDKKALSEAQMQLFKDHGINPVAGCLPQIAQLVVLIALYRVFINILGTNGVQDLPMINDLLYTSGLHLGEPIRTQFLHLDLAKPDPYIILPALAGAAQFWTSKLVLPKVKKGEELAKKTLVKSDDALYNMQEQMLYVMPVMTVLIGWKLPAGLALYWLVTTLFSLGQQAMVRGARGK